MKHPDIPSFAYKLFRWFCKDYLFEELEGDLEEKFLLNKEKHGLRKARRIYTREVLKMIRPTVISAPKSGPGLQLALLASYVTISFRNLKRHKLFSFINVFSLSVAMSSGLLVIGMVSDLLQFDEFQEHKNEVYRVITTPYYQSREYKTSAASPLPLGEEMMRQVPNIKVTNLARRMQGNATANDKQVFVQGIYADEHFFDFLSFNLDQGNPVDVLKEPFSILLSETFVEKVFEDQNPIGETIEIEGLGSYTVTGIVEDPPQFSHIQFEAIVSLSTVDLLARQGMIEKSHDSWESLERYYNYVYIPDEATKKYVEQWLANTAPNFYQEPDKMIASFSLQPLNQIVPGPNISDSIGPKMIWLPIIILSVIAAAILLSAIFNYTNLSMARSLRRAREVGVRKLNGASGKSVFLQFTIEAIILSFLSLGFGVLLFTILREQFIDLLPRAEEMVTLQLTPQLIGWFSVFALVTGLIAGMAPSVFFARLSSLNALRSGRVLKALSGINFRKSLIVAQFTLSIIFVMAVVITHKQYSYSLNTDMGFNKENILNVYLQENDPEIVKAELMKLPEVSSVSFSSYTLGVGTWNNLRLVDPRNQDSVWVHDIMVDENFIANLDIELVAGRNFEPGENKNRESSIIINERFVRSFGLSTPEEAIGSTFIVGDENVQIIGVVKDLKYANLEEEIKSFVIRNVPNYRIANVKLSSNEIINTLDRMEGVWEEIDSNHRFKAQFFDQQIEGYYQFLVDFMKIFGFIGFLAISISCLGLFGMAIYATETRLKEIGIRKTFGASEGTLIFLLSKGFLKMVLLAIVIGSPISYFLFDRVILAESVYRPQITIVEVGGSIAFLLILCFLTIITQTWSAARRNPATVLRDE